MDLKNKKKLKKEEMRKFRGGTKAKTTDDPIVIRRKPDLDGLFFKRRR